MENLASACEPATFGVDQKDVLDESYRKARKLDVAHFATTFELRKSRIMDVVRAALLERHDSNIPVEADLYKLNVYGECRTNNLNNWSYVHPSDHCTCSDKGSFFKSHRDTPRSGTMFASLVVIFPVAHEGGALKLCHGGNEWTVDSATVNNTTSPVISYIAFYSDVEHEVTPVTSGHRVTLTWNLYFQPTVKPPDYFLLPNLSVHPKTSESEQALKAAFNRVLSDSNFLPEGGRLGFGLRQEYPLNPDMGLGNLVDCLKGSDAIVQSVCRQHSLRTSLRIIYQQEEVTYDRVMLDHFFNFPPEQKIESLDRIDEGGIPVSNIRPVTVEGYNYYESPEVVWVTDLTEYTRAKTAYLAHGNEAFLGYVYCTVCLIVDVGPFGDRTANID